MSQFSFLVLIKRVIMNRNKNSWNFDNSYSKLSDKLYSHLLPTPVLSPNLLLFNENLMEELGLALDLADKNRLSQWFSGNEIPLGAQPLAQAYAGHQFGHFNKLGDGRAILLGEQITPSNNRVDIQLKGAGPTPYSRNGDGRATLRAMLREYLISEAMHGLEIPTSRSLALVTSGEKVFREEVHEGAILTRIAASHIRVGTFEYVRNFLSLEEQRDFTNYVLHRHYPALLRTENPPLELLRTVMNSQIDLVVNWMRVGFIHGVLNTDNVSIAGETFDYGPCAFMNAYHPSTVFSSIDVNGRYAFGNQPKITHWNMVRFAEALLPLFHAEKETAIELAKEVLNSYPSLFEMKWTAMMGRKLGFDSIVENEAVKKLIDELLEWMEKNKADYTLTFLEILKLPNEWSGIYQQPSFVLWYEKWKSCLFQNGCVEETVLLRMVASNPCFIPRNHLVEEALDEVCFNDNFTVFNQMLQVMASPYKEYKAGSRFKFGPMEGDGNYKTFCGT
jgi:uncharacterized protein YdiU (UPF0061 family)